MTKANNQHRAIYPGTFDPITNGHIDLIQRSLAIFDEVIVLVAHSGKKEPLFDALCRKELIEKSFAGDRRVKVEIYSGLLVDYAKQHCISAVLRGLRAVSDFEYEFQMATMNRRMYPQLQTVFLMSSENFIFVNSTLVKEVISHGGDVSELVPPHVNKKLKERLCSNTQRG
ncbi:MAG: pantetheine-phosphate adenylyltransferase [Deltaproteobacteria bacterium]|nr:pantetheine-phosphate adenylyltransferase [Deltaproteobacteria bacterium]